MACLSAVSNSTKNTLETIIIADGCAGLQNISFKGCTNLKSLVLGGLFDELYSIDISGTTVKTLDLSAMTAQKLNGLFLLDCDKFCAILWPPEEKRREYLGKLRIDTMQLASAARTGEEKANQGTRSAKSSVVLRGARAPSDHAWYISVKDARLLRSVVPLIVDHYVLVEISSAKHPAVDVGGSKNEAGIIKGGIIAGCEQPSTQKQQTEANDDALVHADVAAVAIKDHLFQASELGYGDAQTITPIWPCPDAPYMYGSGCYMYIQDKVMANKLPMDEEEYTTGSAISIPDFVSYSARILHVHDSLSITSIPGHASWNSLRWCLVERCPMLEFIFTVRQLGSGQGVGSCKIFWYSRTLWVSQLPKARFVWDTSKLSLGQISVYSFVSLAFLHLDFCPRLIHVLPFCQPTRAHPLETLEIVWCVDLRTIFPLHSDTESYQEQQPRRATTTVEFPYLKRIHLHELPKLRSICGSGRMYAPNLETIKIRGCWSLTRLPAVGSWDWDSGSEKVECDCEKDWWARLHCDGPQANHLPSHYKPTHPRYYKKTLLRGSVLL